MTDDDVFRELLKSPLDESPAGEPRRGRIAAFLAAGLGGAALALVAVLIIGDSPAPSTTVPATSPTTVTGPATTTDAAVAAASSFIPPPFVLPLGYTATGDQIGMRPEWMHAADDRLYVGLSSSTGPELPPSGADAFPGGDWMLVLAGGGEIPFEREWRYPTAVGFVTLSFPLSGATPDEADHLVVRPATATATESFESPLAIDSVPWDWEGPPLQFELDDGSMLTVSSIMVRQLAAGAEWALDATPPGRAVVEAQISIPGEDEPIVILAPAADVPARFAQLNEGPAAPVRAGTASMLRSERAFGEGPFDATITFTVTRQTYDSEPIELPLDGVRSAGA